MATASEEAMTFWPRVAGSFPDMVLTVASSANEPEVPMLAVTVPEMVGVPLIDTEPEIGWVTALPSTFQATVLAVLPGWTVQVPDWVAATVPDTGTVPEMATVPLTGCVVAEASTLRAPAVVNDSGEVWAVV